MGLRKFWKPPKEMSLEESRDFRQENGSRSQPSDDSINRKMKFDSFKSYASNQPKKAVVPITPQGQEEYSSYDNHENSYQQQSSKPNLSQYHSSYNSSESSFTPYKSQRSQSYQSYQPYGDSQTLKTQTAATATTDDFNNYNSYDPYGPGATDNQTIKTDVTKTAATDLNNYDTYDPYGEANTLNPDVTDSFQQLQLNESKTTQNVQDQDQKFDPYGPAASTAATQDLNFNNYEPAEFDEFQDYDHDEFSQELNEDEAELARITRQTKDLREDTVNVSSNIVSNLKQGNITAMNSLGVLGSQREKIYSMERKMNNIEDVQEETTEHIKQLDHYKRPLYHIKINNPLTKAKRGRAREAAMDRKMYEQDAREDATNANLYASQNALLSQFNNESSENIQSELKNKYEYERRVKEAQKYLTSDHDQEDADMENQIASNLEDALKEAERLKNKAIAMSDEISKQNQDLQQMSERTTKANHRVMKATSRLRGV